MRATTVIAEATTETIRFFVTWVTFLCLSGGMRVSILMALSLEVTISILNPMIHDDAEFLSCRMYFRRPLLCYCRRFVSDYVPFSLSNQFVVIGPRMKWCFWQLSFPSAIWFGDEIWLFDPGIFGAWNDSEDVLKTCFLQTPVDNTVSRPGHRIWWSEQPIRLCLYLLVVTLNLWGLEILDLLGSRVVDRWGCDLPFLFTALSVTNALSFMGIGDIIVFAFMEFTQAALVVRRCSLAYSQGIRRSWYRMEKEAKSKIVQMTMIQKIWYHNVNNSELIWKHQVYHAVSKHGVSAKKWYPRIIRIRARFCISSHYMAHKYAYVIIWFSKVLYTDFVNLS